jgi:hypothetical protein
MFVAQKSDARRTPWMKLAFLFLTQDDHNQGELWEAFFGNLSRERYSIFCHPKFPDRVTQPFL